METNTETTAQNVRSSVRRVVASLSSLARLEQELGRTELARKGAAVGIGVGIAVAAVLLLPLVVLVGLAVVAAALALVLDVWLALLIVFGLLLLILVALGAVAATLLRRSAPLKPEQALEEARLTRQVLRSARAR